MKLEISIILMMLHNNKILLKYCLSELKNNVFEEDSLNIKKSARTLGVFHISHDWNVHESYILNCIDVFLTSFN